MHLFALLIATALASNFVAPNAAATAISISPKFIEAGVLAAGTTPVITLTVTPTGTGQSGQTVTIDKKEASTPAPVAISAGAGTAELTLATTAITSLGAVKGTDTPLVVKYVDGETSGGVTTALYVADTWTIAPAADGVNTFYDTDLTKIPALKIVPTSPEGLQVDDLKAVFTWTRAPSNAEVELDIIYTPASEANAPESWTIAADQSLAALGILTKDFAAGGSNGDVEVTVTIKLADGEEYPVTSTLTVELNEPTVDADGFETITEVETAAKVEFTIAETAGSNAWSSTTVVIAKFTDVKTKPTATTGDFVATGVWNSTDSDFDFEIDLLKFDWTNAKVTKEIYVYLNVDTGAGGSNAPTWLDAPLTLTFTPEPAVAGTFTITAPTMTYTELAAGKTFVIAASAGGSDTPLAAGVSRFEIEYTDEDLEKHIVGGKITSPSSGVFNLVTGSLTELGIPNDAKSCVVRVYPRGTTNKYNVDGAITVSAVAAEFTVDPSTLDAIPTSIPKITITALDDATWTVDEIEGKLECGENAPIKFNLEAVASGDSNGDAKVFETTAAVLLTNWNLANNSVINVYVAKARADSPTYLPVHKTITITLDPVLEFDFLPVKITQAMIDEGDFTVSAKPKTDNWDAAQITQIDVVFSLDGEEAPADDADGFELAKPAPGSNPDLDYVGTANLEEFDLEDDTENIYAWIRLTLDDSANTDIFYYEVPYEVEYEAGEAPKADFTVDPDGIDLKKVKDKVTLKVKETIAQGSQAAWAADVYAIVSKTELADAPLLTAMTKTTFETPVYKFEHDISTYEPKLKKGDKLYLYVTHSVTTEAPAGSFLKVPVVLTVSAAGRAAPLLSLLAAVLFCLVKLF